MAEGTIRDFLQHTRREHALETMRAADNALRAGRYENAFRLLQETQAALLKLAVGDAVG